MKGNCESSEKHIILATPAPTSHRTAEENLGLGYLTAVLRKEGFNVDLIDGWLEKLTPQEIALRILRSNTPLFVGFSSYRSNMDKAKQTADILRNSGFKRPIIAGGFGPTFHAEDFLNAGFDVVIRGEGEKPCVDLANHYYSGAPDLKLISGASFIEDGKVFHSLVQPMDSDLNLLPFPARDTIQFSKDRRSPVHIVSARGCEAHCLYCSIVAFQRLGHGPQWRQRSIENFVDEIESLHKQDIRHFKVLDDSFMEPPRDELWAKSLASELKKRNIEVSLRGQIRADRLTDPIVYQLKEAGFISFSCGIENFSPTALKRMAKTATLDQNLDALHFFKKYGLIMQQGMIMFDYGTTIEELEENYRGLRENDHTVIKGVFTEMFAAQGTPFTKLLDKKGALNIDTSGMGNHKYKVEDKKARAIYLGLKMWHKSHSTVYDKAIDPVSAPKALDYQQLLTFMPLIKDLRHKDLDFMRDLLDMCKQGADQNDVVKYAQNQILKTAAWYQRFDETVDGAYRTVGLEYDGDPNPFLCD